MDLEVAAFAPGFDAEAPGLDALVPVGADEAVVAVQAGAGEQEAGAVAAVRGAQRVVDQGAAEAVGLALPQRVAVTAGYAHLGLSHRLAGIEGGDPDQRVVAAGFQMHGQVGDQRRGAHVHRLRRGEQRRTEQLALDFDDVVARLAERNADHFELAAAARLGQFLPADAGAFGEEGEFAGVVGVEALLALAVDLQADLGGLLLEFLQGQHGGDDVGVLGQPLLAEAMAAGQREAAGLQAGLDIAQGDRQQAAFLQFDNAETAGKFGQRRQLAGSGRQRKTGRIAQRPAGFILEAGRDLEFHLGVLREGRGKAERAEDRFLLATFLVRVERAAWAVAGQQPEFAQKPGIECGIESQRDGRKGGAGRAGLFPFAAKGGLERLAHLVDEAFLLLARRAVQGLDTFAPDQFHLAAGRQVLAAADDQGIAAHAAGEVEHGGADFRTDRAGRNALADAIGLAPQVALQRFGIERAATIDDEGLVFLDRRAGSRQRAPGARRGTKELETALAAQGFAIACGQPAFQGKNAAFAGL